MKKLKAIPKCDLGYPEYPYINWVKGQEYECIICDDTIKIADEQGCTFYFSTRAKEKLNEIFDFK